MWTARANPPQLVRYAADRTSETIVDDGRFNFPHHVIVDAAGQIAYVADGYEKCIWKVDSGAAPEKLVSGDPLQKPT